MTLIDNVPEGEVPSLQFIIRRALLQAAHASALPANRQEASIIEEAVNGLATELAGYVRAGFWLDYEPSKEQADYKFEFQLSPDKPLGLDEAVGQALGAASTCWERLDFTGVFQDQNALQIARVLTAYVRGGTWLDFDTDIPVAGADQALQAVLRKLGRDYKPAAVVEACYLIWPYLARFLEQKPEEPAAKVQPSLREQIRAVLPPWTSYQNNVWQWTTTRGAWRLELASSEVPRLVFKGDNLTWTGSSSAQGQVRDFVGIARSVGALSAE